MSSVACLWTFSQNHISFSNSFLLLPSSTSKDPLIPLDLPRKSRTFFLSEHCCYCSIAQLGPTLCDPMDCSTPGFSVLHHLPDFAHIHIHWVSDAIQPSHPLSSPSSTLNLSQHQGLYQWVAIHIRWPKFWSFSFSFSPSNEYSGLISFRIDWFDLLMTVGVDFLGGLVAKTLCSQCKGPGLIPGQGTRSHLPKQKSRMPQWRLKIPCPATKT